MWAPILTKQRLVKTSVPMCRFMGPTLFLGLWSIVAWSFLQFFFPPGPIQRCLSKHPTSALPLIHVALLVRDCSGISGHTAANRIMAYIDTSFISQCKWTKDLCAMFHCYMMWDTMIARGLDRYSQFVNEAYTC